MLGRLILCLASGLLMLPACGAISHDAPDETLFQDSKLLHHPVSRVYGGQQIIAGTFRYAHISLLNELGTQHQCGGSIVASDIIVTAAHCKPWFDTLRLHDWNEVSETTNLPYSDIIPHPNFDSDTYDSDIMVIKLTEPLIDATILELNNGHYDPFFYNSLTVVGWGLTDESEGKAQVFPGVLHYVDVPYVDNQDCQNITVNGKQLYQGEITNNMLCAGGSGLDACQGDSGSPLVLSITQEADILVGIVSWGRGCATYPGVYTRVSSFYEWTRSQICWSSLDPPTYLDCNPEERDPVLLTSPTKSPVVSWIPATPTKSPVVGRFPTSPSPSSHRQIVDSGLGHQANKVAGENGADELLLTSGVRVPRRVDLSVLFVVGVATLSSLGIVLNQ